MRKRTLNIKDHTAYNNDRYDEMKSLLSKSRKKCHIFTGAYIGKCFQQY